MIVTYTRDDEQQRYIITLTFNVPDRHDWAEVCNRARAAVFPDVPLPAVDLEFQALKKRWKNAKG